MNCLFPSVIALPIDLVSQSVCNIIPKVRGYFSIMQRGECVSGSWAQNPCYQMGLTLWSIMRSVRMKVEQMALDFGHLLTNDSLQMHQQGIPTTWSFSYHKTSPETLHWLPGPKGRCWSSWWGCVNGRRIQKFLHQEAIEGQKWCTLFPLLLDLRSRLLALTGSCSAPLTSCLSEGSEGIPLPLFLPNPVHLPKRVVPCLSSL